MKSSKSLRLEFLAPWASPFPRYPDDTPPTPAGREPRRARGRRRRGGARVLRPVLRLRAARPERGGWRSSTWATSSSRSRRAARSRRTTPPFRPRRRRQGGGRGRALEEAGVEILPGRGLDFRDPWGNRIEVVDYRDIQFTKAPEVSVRWARRSWRRRTPPAKSSAARAWPSRTRPGSDPGHGPRSR